MERQAVNPIPLSLIVVFYKKLDEANFLNSRTMALRANKGKEVAIASKRLKRFRKGVASSSSAQKALPARRFRDKTVENH
ncbi:hypothetical protein HAX54_030260, partial [Datura stramonium]|nr:hypothetical protein [Datura stramonium]